MNEYVLLYTLHWSCYITVDFATTASQNGFITYKLSLYWKTKFFFYIKTKKTFRNLEFYYFPVL
jgi:hypothetical protein